MGMVGEGLRVVWRGSGKDGKGRGGEMEQGQGRWMGLCEWVYVHTCPRDISISQTRKQVRHDRDMPLAFRTP